MVGTAATGGAPGASSPLQRLLLDAVDGRFPPADGGTTVLRPTSDVGWVVSFTAHAVIVTTADEDEVRAHGADGYGASLTPAFLTWLAGPGGTVGCQDAVLASRGTGHGETLPVRTDVDDHPRVRDARRLRRDVRVLGDERGFVTVGSGLGGLLEIGIEVAPERLGTGAGRSLLADTLGSLPRGAVVLAQVTPGNARSLRSFLAAGFVPLGSAVTILPAGSSSPGG